jgi:hypothetical protein
VSPLCLAPRDKAKGDELRQRHESMKQQTLPCLALAGRETGFQVPGEFLDRIEELPACRGVSE